jgi:SnoaL-like domain
VPNAEHTNIVEHPFDDLFTRGDLDAVDSLVAPDFVAHGQGGSESTRGREAFRVACNSGRVTYRGGLLGIPSEGQRVLETGILILRVEDGLVQEVWSGMSGLQVMMQLGAFPPPKQDEGGTPAEVCGETDPARRDYQQDHKADR